MSGSACGVGGMSERYRVGVLGATGLVGQRLVSHLEDHPWFQVVALAASDRSVGLSYREAARWSLPVDAPPRLWDQKVRACRPDELKECDFVLSALTSQVAREVERAFAGAGFAVISNSSAHRQAPDVPLLVPEVNADHLAMVESQRRGSGGGFIVTNPNCSVAGLIMALAPLHRAFGVRRLVVSTLQALSGAGTDGPRALELVDNVVPWIPGEEEKFEQETRKMLGSVEGGKFIPADMRVSAHCHRVATLDGHLQAVSVELASKATVQQASRVLSEFRGDVAELELPSSPERPILVLEEPDRPQPRLDRDRGDGMSVVVGRLRTCPVFNLRFELLVHNAVRGAAGAASLNAELLAAREMLPRRPAR